MPDRSACQFTRCCGLHQSPAGGIVWCFAVAAGRCEVDEQPEYRLIGGGSREQESAPSLPPRPFRRRMRVQRRPGEKSPVQRGDQGVQVGPGPAWQGRERLFQPPAWGDSAAFSAHACRRDPVDGSGSHCLRPREQRLRYLTRPHSGVFEPDHRGHGTTAETRDVMDRDSVSSAQRPTYGNLRGAPTRHGPF